MRGIRVERCYTCGRYRFIPAHAGNSARPSLAARQPAVHPRACGEFQIDHAGGLAADGSSPRMRGIRLVPTVYITSGRFIPAHAGNSGARRGLDPAGPVHPRACGEFTSTGGTAVSRYGSSPRMRGIRRAVAEVPPAGRFIPAHAGNSLRQRRAGSMRAVHPRACGEFIGFDPDVAPGNGSSPRMRGIPFLQRQHFLIRRFIPAHAGNSFIRSVRHILKAVHPRACGEFSDYRRSMRQRSGSSPRMRGIR